MTDAKFTCRRRTWGNQGEDYFRVDDTCSFCGSLNADVLMARLEAGDVQLGPTDKSYKAYVRNQGGALFKQTYRDCPPGSAPHMPDACEHWVTRETTETKFYFQHLSRDQKLRFIELLNDKKVALGYPGYFYTKPYFITYEPEVQ